MPWVDESRYPGEVDRLATLPLALDPAHMRPVLAERAPAAFGARFAIDELDVDIYRRHGNRCVIRYRARGASAANGGVEWASSARCCRRRRGAAGREHARAVVARLQRGAADGIGVPEPIAYLPSCRCTCRKDVGGVSIRNLVKRGLDERHFRSAARALAKLHGCGLPAGPVRGVDAHLLRCHPRHPVLGLAFPELAARVDDIVERARALERRLPSIPVTPVHGDFHLGQVHVDGDRAWLVDLDALGFADPPRTSGTCSCSSRTRSAATRRWRRWCRRSATTTRRTPRSPVWDRVPLYAALTHLRRACKQLRLQQPGWRDKVHAMVERSAREITEAESLAGAHANGGAA
jgi:hypothetical protein